MFNGGRPGTDNRGNPPFLRFEHLYFHISVRTIVFQQQISDNVVEQPAR